MTSLTAAATTEAGLAAIVGARRVSSDPADCAAFAVDGQAPSQAVYPATPEEVAAVLRYCADRDLAVIPCRNGTKLGIGNPPHRYDVALSLKEMNQVWYYEPADLVMSVEPGMKLGDLQHFLARNWLWLPLDPPGGERASMGGILAANAAGPLRLHYGGPRDMVLGMKIATTEGKIIKTGGRVVKNVAGYDLAKLLIGSYGTLGVIVEATFKLYPLPSGVARYCLAAGTLDIARRLRRSLQLSPLRPQRMVLVDARFIAGLHDRPGFDEAQGGFEIWIEMAGAERTLARSRRELESMARSAGAGFRELATDPFNESLWKPTEGGWMVKVALPLSAVEGYLGNAERESPGWAWGAEPGSGIVHGGLRAPEPGTEETVRKLRRLAAEFGGTLMVEAAPSQAKPSVDVWGPLGDDFEVMRKVKAAWDPAGVLSPGRFLGGL